MPEIAQASCAISILEGVQDLEGSSPEKHGLSSQLTRSEQKVRLSTS